MNALYECNAYACYDKCEKNLDNCSSGGVFGILASHVIRMGAMLLVPLFGMIFLSIMRLFTMKRIWLA